MYKPDNGLTTEEVPCCPCFGTLLIHYENEYCLWLNFMPEFTKKFPWEKYTDAIRL